MTSSSIASNRFFRSTLFIYVLMTTRRWTSFPGRRRKVPDGKQKTYNKKHTHTILLNFITDDDDIDRSGSERSNAHGKSKRTYVIMMWSNFLVTSSTRLFVSFSFRFFFGWKRKAFRGLSYRGGAVV